MTFGCFPNQEGCVELNIVTCRGCNIRARFRQRGCESVVTAYSFIVLFLFDYTIAFGVSENEKKQKLKSIIREFATVILSYGFTIEDIINELKNQKP